MVATSRIVIENGIARHETTTVLNETTLQNLLPQLEKRGRITTPIAPDGLLSSAYDGDTKKGIFLIQRPPIRQIIRIIDREEGGEDYDEWNLQFPWLIFQWAFITGTPAVDGYDDLPDFSINESHLYWAPRRITRLTDRVWPARIPNVYENGEICWGDTTAATGTIAERLNDRSINFLSTRFNWDVSFGFPNGYGQFQGWEAESSNPLIYETWSDWSGRGSVTIDSLLQPVNPRPREPQVSLDLPRPPDIFTIGRARAWARETGDARARRVLLAGIQLAVEDIDKQLATELATEVERLAAEGVPA